MFAKLHAARAFARRNLPFVETLEDFDLLLEIGVHQQRGTPLTMKKLYLLDLASVATIQRRLRRLKRRGAVIQRKSPRDRRVLELEVSSKVVKALNGYAEFVFKSPGPPDELLATLKRQARR